MSKRESRGRDSGEAIDAGVRAWASERAAAVTEHPAPEELVDYQEGSLAPGGLERIQEHLLVCATCRGELLDLDVFDRERPGDEAPLVPSDELTERSWQRFEAARAAMRAAPDGQRGSGRVVRVHPRRWWSRTTWTMAASIALAMAVGAVVAAALLGRIEPGGGAGEGSPFVFDLDPNGTAVLREFVTVPEVAVPAGMDPIIARLNLGDLTAHEGYEAEVYDRRDQLVLRRKGLARDRSGSVTFMASREEWPGGEYRVHLVALDAERRQELAAYALRLRYET